MADLENYLQSSGRSSSVLGGIANPGQVNVLGAYAGAAETAQQMYRARDLQARQLVGEAYQNSLKDGVPDQQQFNRNIVAAGPNAAMQALTGSQQGQTLDQTTFDLHNKRIAGVSLALAQLTAEHPDGKIPQDEINAAIDAQLKDGNLTPETAAQSRAQFGADPVANGRLVMQNHFRVLSAQEALSAARPATSLHDTGTAIVPLQTPPAGSTSQQPGSVTQPSGGAATGATPTQLAQPFKYTDPTTGQEVTEPYGAFLDRFHLRPPPGAQPGTPVLPPSLRNPANKPAPDAQPAPPPANGAQPAPNQPAPAPTAPPPGMAEKWKASADQYTADTAAAGQYQSRIFPLAQSRALLDGGDVTTGQGAEAVNRVKSVLMTAATTFGWDTQTIKQAKFDELNKYLTQYTNNLPMAGASDARLASALTGNPSAHISTLANKDVVKALIGLERMKQTAITDFANSGGQPKDYADYLRNWQNTHDPRAFIFDMMKDGDRAKMVAGMKTDAERKAFGATLDLVQRNPGVMGQAPMPQH